jgi:hypothetical protein
MWLHPSVMLRRALPVTLLAGCFTQTTLPPPPPPARVMPSVPGPMPNPEPNHGVVTIDADEPSTVALITGTYDGIGADGTPSSGLTYKTVCSATPCVTSLRLGSRDLVFTSNLDPMHGGQTTIAVGDQPSVLRYALGHNWSPPLAPGIGVMVGGIVATFAGAFTAAFAGTNDNGGGLNTTGYVGLGATVVGAVAIVVGVRMIMNTAFGGTVQSGTATQWSPGAP